MGRWRIASRVDHPDPADANALALADLEGGADTLVLVSAEAPTAYGFGTALSEPGALEAVLAGVPIDLVGLRFDLGRDGLAVAGRLADHCGRRGHPPARLDLGLDPVGWLAQDGAPSGDWSAAARDLAGCVRDLDARGFEGFRLRADGRVWHAAGASDAQELAAVIASGVLYLRTLDAADVDLDRARSIISFAVTAESDLVATVAKLRALRRLWASVEAACGLDPKPIHIHADTAWRSMTAASSHTNIVRSAAAAVAAVLGGADGVTVLPYTQPVGLPDADARRIARNTQHVLAEESQLWRVTDPVAGSHVFESETRAVGEQAWAEMQAIEREGGIATSLRGGGIQRRVGTVRRQRQQQMARGDEILVGANRFQDETGTLPTVLDVAHRVYVGTGGRGAAEPLPSTRMAEPHEEHGSDR